MTDVNAYLGKSLDGLVIPQYKKVGEDAFEPAEGSEGALHVKLIGSNNGESIMTRETVSLSSSETGVFHLSEKPLIVDYIEWSTNGTACRLEISHYDKLGEPLGLANFSGSNISGYSPSTISTRGSGIFDIVEHDTVNGNFKYSMNRPIEFPKGARIRAVNGGSSNADFAIVIFGREF